MKASDLPGELDTDYIALKNRLSDLMDAYVAIGEEKAKIDIFNKIRKLLVEKEAAQDHVAVAVIDWVISSLADT